MKWIRKLGKVTVKLVQIGCFVVLTDRYVGSFVRCAGSSMEPTLFNQDVVLAENITVRRSTLQKGDIVIARSPTDPTEFICKRLVAMEGDKVWVTVEEGNDTLDEKFDVQKKIPKGYVWLEGDNRSNSYDCQHYGAIPAGLLTRRVFFRIWPVSNMGFVKHPDELKRWR